MTPIDMVLQRLDRVRQSKPGQWKARCPAHEDNDPSLSVSVGDDGRVLLRCHAGCSVEAICTVIGIGVRDLFPSGAPHALPPRPSTPPPGPLPPPPSAAKQNAGFATTDVAVRAATSSVQRERGADWRLAKSYSYDGDEGREVMRVLRFEPSTGGDKTFRPLHTDGSRWFIGDPNDPLPLYRITTLAQATTIYVVEGEKAADAAVALGLVATTSAHGAKAASRTDWSLLAGKDVVILPDKDEAGRQYCQDVARTLVGLQPRAQVRIVDLPDVPEQGDLVEFVAARRGAGLDDQTIKDEIEMLAKAAPTYGSSGGAEADHGPSGGSDGPSRGASQESRGSSGSSGGGGPGSLPDFGEPEPLPNDLPPVDRFDPWMLPKAFFGWIKDIAERIQCPMDFPAVAAMVALASVLGRKIGIRPKQCDDWLVVPNLWGALIGRPGIMKTPPLQEATRPLRRLETAAKEAFEAESKRYEAELIVFEARKKSIQGDIKNNLKAKDDDGALAAAQEVIESEPERPVRRRYLVNDSTVEKLGEILNENPNGVLVLRDELVGLLKNLDKEGQEGARAFYLEAWNGNGSFTYDRIVRGTIDIEAAIVSILGSIQPGPLRGYLQSAIAGGKGDDGLMSRFQLAVWPDVSPEWRNVDTWPDTEAKNTAYGVFTWFDGLTAEDVGAGKDQDDDDTLPYLRLDQRAQRVFDRWRGGLERRLRSGEEHPALESHFAKYRSLIPALALLIHLADGGTGPVGLEPLRKALAWGRYLSSHARRIYASAVMADVAAARRLAARIKKGDVKDGFTERDVYHNDWSGLDREAVQQAVTVLVDHGWLRSQIEQTPGRSKTVYRINPRIPKGRQEGTDKAAGSGEENVGQSQGGTDKADGSPVSADASSGSAPEGTDRTDRSWGEL